MASAHHPRRGSMGYWHRCRAKSVVPRIKSWAADGDKSKLQGFAGYKAGMTYAFVLDYRPTSTTSGQEVRMPVTVIEVPPMKVAAVRAYEKTPYGLKTLTEAWATEIDEELARRMPVPKESNADKAFEVMAENELEDIRVLCYTMPMKVTGVQSKTPETMEIRVGGGTIKERLDYAKSLLGKEIVASETIRAGDMLDIAAVTTGKGFQCRVQRFGTKLLTHKNSKHRRMIGTQGAWHPAWIQSTVPNDGQMGYHNRVEYNKRVIKVGENGEEITPAGGFVNYGVVRNSYLLIHGSIPGPARRIVRIRDAVRYTRGIKVEAPEITYVSTTSKQGA
ncbi:MAG: 50S ribosomal protein L3 [Thermoplasmata archaeon HGW-Thermoplasmata-1]|nr:MAG: 50S ribosomal protein L3 [Thermoplasmata archaeon HGW-Thermoplasmata-1]